MLATTPPRGRTAEFEVLAAWLAPAARGAVRVVILEGESGIGKTQMLGWARDMVAQRGRTVFWGRATEFERTRPFGPLAEALLGAAASVVPGRVHLERLLEHGARADPAGIPLTRDPALQYRVVDAVVEVVEEAALHAPVALLLDDLHWADPATLLGIHSLARRLGYLDVTIIATVRPTLRTPHLDTWLDGALRAGAHHLRLGPLDDRAVAELVEDLVGVRPGATLTSAVAGAAGNPLLVTELVRAMDEEGAIQVVDGQLEVTDPSLPQSLRAATLRRLAFLDDEVIDVLRHASVLGSTFSVRDLATVSERPIAVLVRILQEPIRAGLLAESGGRSQFRHDLVRASIYEEMFTDVRAALHLEAGRRLAAAGAPALQVAEHLVLGARAGDADAVAGLHDAARSAASQAPAVAVELLERALELDGAHGPRRLALLADLVPALLWSGRPHDAVVRVEQALSLRPPPAVEAGLRLALVQALSVQGEHRALIDEVDRAGRAKLTDDVRSQLLAEAANARLFTGPIRDAESVAREAIAIGGPILSEGAESGLMVLSDAARAGGALLAALQYAEEALRLAEEREGVRRGWRPEIFLAMALRSLDRFGEADDAIERGRRADERLGRLSYLPVYSYERATGLFLAGRWDEALAEAEAGVALAEEVGLGMLRSWPTWLRALIAVHRGDLSAAAAHLGVPRDVETRRGRAASGWSPRLALATGLLEEATGDASGAIGTLRRAWDLNEGRGYLAARAILGPDLTRLALHVGDRQRAARVVAGLEALVRFAPVPSVEGAALRCRGLLDADVDALVRSVEAYGRSPRAFDRAQACGDAAVALTREGRRLEASAMFDRALETYADLGARRERARALATARELGVGRRRRGARRRPSYGWASLTPSELEVVRLAAEGLTNPEIGRRLFISRRTVQTHLSHAFGKLEVASRVELAAYVARRG